MIEKIFNHKLKWEDFDQQITFTFTAFIPALDTKTLEKKEQEPPKTLSLSWKFLQVDKSIVISM